LSTPSGHSAKRRLPGWFYPALGYAVSIASIYYVYRKFDWAAEWPRMQQTRLDFVLLAVLCDVAVYCVQGWRWSELLRPIGALPVLRSMQAIYIGLFANEVLPLKPGEVIRSFLQARWSGVPFSVIVSSVVIERLFDGVWLILGFFVASLFVELPAVLVIASHILAFVLVALGGLLGFAVLRRPQAEAWMSRTIWAQGFHYLLDALEAMGRSPTFYYSFLLSLPYLALQVGPIYFLQLGFGLDLSVGACAVILIILRLGAIPPQAPGNVGLFHLLAVLGVRLFGIEEGVATSYATVLFLVITVPLWLVGFFALLATKMKLSQITQAVTPVQQ
jgi:uncharacterized protein (TIRG00374 family)